jgi:hypothetical protein
METLLSLMVRDEFNSEPLTQDVAPGSISVGRYIPARDAMLNRR